MSAPAETTLAPPPAVVVHDRTPGVLELLRESWRHRALLTRVGIRVTVKGYTGTKLGRVWLVLRPVLSIFAMALLFGAVLDAPSNGVPYILFLLAGMIGWFAFERFAFWATRSFDVYRRLAVNVEFPLLLVPTASFVPATIELGVLAGLMGCTALYFGITDGVGYIHLGPELALVPAGIVMCVALAWGLGLWLSTLNARARDVRIVLRYVLMVWLYVTPVIYPVSALPAGWRFLATINPVASPVELVREGLLGVGTISLAPMVVSLATIAVTCAGGLWFFARTAPGALEDPFADEDDDDEMARDTR